MAKKLMAIIFLGVFSYAFWIYANRDEKSLKENSQNRDSEDPKLFVVDLQIQRYKNAILDSKIQVAAGKFIEPNLVAISGGLNFDRITKGQHKRLKATKGLATFRRDSPRGFITTGDLISTELSDDVVVDFGDYRLLTDFAEYFAAESMVVSDRPVTVLGDRKWFRGKNGFRAEMGSETIEIFGKVTGEAFVK